MTTAQHPPRLRTADNKTFILLYLSRALDILWTHEVETILDRLHASPRRLPTADETGPKLFISAAGSTKGSATWKNSKIRHDDTKHLSYVAERKIQCLHFILKPVSIRELSPSFLHSRCVFFHWRYLNASHQGFKTRIQRETLRALLLARSSPAPYPWERRGGFVPVRRQIGACVWRSCGRRHTHG